MKNNPQTWGNLRILQSSLGTSWQLQAKGKILFLEVVADLEISQMVRKEMEPTLLSMH